MRDKDFIGQLSVSGDVVTLPVTFQDGGLPFDFRRFALGLFGLVLSK